ncbi:MAG: glycosyltransferase, partial [Muribaculaceae bacterium]|nr:glycosyltransferase [Muribaculaceae bacterium]
MELKPKVTIVCTVYNHALYLRDCLDGFVMQQTDFPFEAIVHDDCSTDESKSIIAEYAAKYPDIIKPIYETENQYSHHDGSLRRAVERHIRGEYVAICEGDDYWIDSNKLQRQIDFLEANPDYTLSFHAVRIESDRKDKAGLLSGLRPGEYSADDIIKSWSVPTCSAVMKSEYYTGRPYDKRFVVGDNVIWLNCLKHGKAYCHPEQMAVYRRLSTGWTYRNYSRTKDALAVCRKYMTHLELLAGFFPKVADAGIREKQMEYASR